VLYPARSALFIQNKCNVGKRKKGKGVPNSVYESLADVEARNNLRKKEKSYTVY
jgi:hypothetical protein